MTSALGLDDDQRIAVGVAQPEHRRHGAAPARDLGVDVDARGLEGGVVGVDVRNDDSLVTVRLSRTSAHGR
jgi:hypothetical protein